MPVRALLVLLVLIVTLGVRPGRAEPLVCDAASAGLVACVAGKLCECRWRRGGEMTGEPDGWRWDCGLLRPACNVPLATGDPRQDAPPPSGGTWPGTIVVEPRLELDERPLPRARPPGPSRSLPERGPGGPSDRPSR